MARRRRTLELSQQDLDLFHRVVADARPLRPDSTKTGGAKSADGKPAGLAEKASKSSAKPRGGAVRVPATSPAAMADHGPGRVPGVDRRTALRLKRGKTEIDGRIDLHGMTQERARAALAGFVTSGYRHGRRTLLVITGKGRDAGESPDLFRASNPGVLRRMVPRWLSEPPLAGCVVAFSPAQPEHGGSGALYVLLKRRRPS